MDSLFGGISMFMLDDTWTFFDVDSARYSQTNQQSAQPAGTVH